MADTKAIKPEDNKAGTFGETLVFDEVTSVLVSPVPSEAPGIIWAEPGTAKEEAVYFQSKDAGAGTISGLIRDYTNLNGGVGQEHTNGTPWEVMQSAQVVKNLVDIITEGYIQEQATIAYVDADEFTVTGDKTSIYSTGRFVRFNADNTKIGYVVSSSYNGGTQLTTVVMKGVTVPSSLTKIEYATQPKQATGAVGVYYGEDAGADDDYVVSVVPAPMIYFNGMIVVLKVANANTGAATLDVNSLGAKAIKKAHDQDVATGDIEAGSVLILVYDGTNFQMISQLAAAATSSGVSAKLDWGNATLPDANFPSLGRTVGTNRSYKTLDYDQSTDESAFWEYEIPTSLSAVTSAKLVILWTAAAGTAAQAVYWDVVHRALADDEVIDATTTPSEATDSGNDALIATGDLHKLEIPLTTTGWAAGDLLQIRITRDANHASDNLAADAKLIAAFLEIT